MTRNRTDRTRRLAPVLAVVAALTLLAVGCSDDPDPQAAPSIDVELWTLDGEPTNLANFTGGPLVINFFSETCPPCVAEMPAFDAVARSYEGDIAFLGISADATSEAAVRLLEQTGVSYPAVWDREGSALQHFEALGLPTTLLINPEGVVLDKHTGELSEADLRERLANSFGVE